MALPCSGLQGMWFIVDGNAGLRVGFGVSSHGAHPEAMVVPGDSRVHCIPRAHWVRHAGSGL